MKNLMSVSQFANDNQVYFEFYPKYCLVRDLLNKEILLQGNVQNGLYIFNPPQNCKPTTRRKWCAYSKCNTSIDSKRIFDLWHCKLGHPIVEAVKHVLKNNNVECENVSLPYISNSCQMGKSNNPPFLESTTKYNKPLEMVAADLWGPTPVNTDYGFNYYVSFVDSFSRFTWIYFLKSKAKTQRVVIKFIT